MSTLSCAAVFNKRFASAETVEEILHAFARLPEIDRCYKYNAICVTDLCLQLNENIIYNALRFTKACSPSIAAYTARLQFRCINIDDFRYAAGSLYPLRSSFTTGGS